MLRRAALFRGTALIPRAAGLASVPAHAAPDAGGDGEEGDAVQPSSSGAHLASPALRIGTSRSAANRPRPPSPQSSAEASLMDVHGIGRKVRACEWWCWVVWDV